ncbi:EpsI domain-containing exosortase [Tamilnaduibacter salinus]|uniref:EpsI domain-containing exosortase n=1 Tax=Tamilnaduibacter salinus TaxID=1484056 RepID=A0A2A2I5P3_9GAMM|nr:EpsI domain-containing exosortase [Tamilnaduibacter salinus]
MNPQEATGVSDSGESPMISVAGAMAPFLVMATVLCLAWSTVENVVGRWLVFEQAYSQGLLLLAVSVALCARQYRRIRPQSDFYPGWLGPFAAGLLIYVGGDLLVVQAFQQLMVVPLLWLSLALFWGWRQARWFLVPVGVLFFAFPVWEALRLPLQFLTTAVTEFALSAIDIHAVVEGLFVTLPGIGAFEVARGCSGLNYFLVGLTIAFLYGEVLGLRWPRRALIVVMALLMSLLANWVRVSVIIYVGHESEMASPLVRNHATFGWVVFAVALVPVFLVVRWLEQNDGTHGAPERAMAYRAAPARLWGGWVVTVALVVAAELVTGEPWQSAQAMTARTHDKGLLKQEGWVPLYQSNLMGWRPVMSNPDARSLLTLARLRGADSSASDRTRLLAGLYSYDHQRQGAEVIQWSNRLYDVEQFTPVERFRLNSGGAPFSGVTLRDNGTGKRLHLSYGYFVGGHWEATEFDAKVAQLTALFQGRRDASLMILGMTCPDCAVRDTLADITSQYRERVEDYLNRQYR